MLRKLCKIDSEEHLESLLRSLKPYLRNKMRAILIMGGNYEEVNKITEPRIVKIITKLKIYNHQKTTIEALAVIPSIEDIEMKYVISNSWHRFYASG